MPTVTSTDGIELAVHDLGGDPIGPETTPVVLAHATGFCGPVFGPLAGHLRGAHAWAPDLRGHGGSSTPPGHHFAWSGWADDVVVTLDSLGLLADGSPRPVGFGHSGGGAALLLAEQRQPGTFAALYLYEPVVISPGTAVGMTTENPLAAGARARRSTFPSRLAAFDNFASKPPMAAFDPDALQAYVDHGFVDLADGTVRLACRPDDEARMYEMARHSGAYDHLGLVTCPVVVARGRVNPAEPGPAAWVDEVAAALPHGRVEVFDDLAHFGPMEDPVRLAAALQRVLDAE